jgi:hypothetical protein
MQTHDVICDTFATIVRNVGFHVGREQLHALPSTQINIVFTKSGIHILVDVVIINPMRAYLLFKSCATFDGTHAKQKNYRD